VVIWWKADDYRFCLPKFQIQISWCLKYGHQLEARLVNAWENCLGVNQSGFGKLDPELITAQKNATLIWLRYVTIKPLCPDLPALD
jgi:hypothetical protein